MNGEEALNVLRTKGYTYLVHTGRKDNLEKLFSTTLTINTPYERYQNKINTDGVYSVSDFIYDENSTFTMEKCNYPGIFFHLVTFTIEEMKVRYKEYDNTIQMVFPLELLLQKNWHFKIIDKNGIIDYDTYFPENMHEIPSYKEIKDYYESTMGYYLGNEVVFHDGISLSNCICILNKEQIDLPIPFELKLDLNKKPNYVYYSDRKYDGIKIKYFNKDYRDEFTTSDEFYINFIRKHLPERFKYLCDNVQTKKELELKIFEVKINDLDLFTYLHLSR